MAWTGPCCLSGASATVDRAHGGYLRQHSRACQFAGRIIHDYTKLDLDPKTRAMRDFAAKLTKDPSSNKKADVERPREAG